MSIKIGVLGAGIMGRGVAQRFASYGCKIILIDVSKDRVEQARNEIIKQLKVSKMFDSDIDIDRIMDSITVSVDYQDLRQVDFIIENITENIEVKEKAYKQLEDICKKECIFLANTSCIPVTLIGSYTERPGNIIGVHFMNPVPLISFTEVIRGAYTSDVTVETVKALLEDVDISTEVISDSAGFVSNRLSHLFMNEAAFLVYENVAEAKQIDNIFKKAFGHKMGPLETADLIGIDTVLDSLKVLYDHYEDTKFRACPLLKKKVYAGELGRKTGKGFYKY